MSTRQDESWGVQLIGALCLAVAGIWLVLLGLGGGFSLTWSAIQLVVGATALILGSARVIRLMQRRAADRAS